MPTVDEPPTAQSMFRTRPLQAGASHSDIVTTAQVKLTVINAVIVFFLIATLCFIVVVLNHLGLCTNGNNLIRQSVAKLSYSISCNLPCQNLLLGTPKVRHSIPDRNDTVTY